MAPHPTRIFLCGDVVTARGVDQILPHAGDPTLHESYIKDARDYVTIAEERNGPIPAPVDFDYIWGDALQEILGPEVDARVINLETSVTTSENWQRDKGIHYRMHPRNVPCLTAAGVDCCVLANNHVLDWGREGLRQTLDTLHEADLATCGAGADAGQAAAPAALDLPSGGRLLILSLGFITSGIPADWQATADRPGVNLLRVLNGESAGRAARHMREFRRPGDIVVASVHWGGNWGYEIPDSQVQFAHALIDAGIDIVHGHSSHHVKGLEVYRNRPIFYGCGDFITDYEGIRGYEQFRGQLTLAYFPVLAPGSGLVELRMVPYRLKRFQLHRAGGDDAHWLLDVLNREGEPLGTRFQLDDDDSIGAVLR